MFSGESNPEPFAMHKFLIFYCHQCCLITITHAHRCSDFLKRFLPIFSLFLDHTVIVHIISCCFAIQYYKHFSILFDVFLSVLLSVVWTMRLLIEILIILSLFRFCYFHFCKCKMLVFENWTCAEHCLYAIVRWTNHTFKYLFFSLL